MHAQGDRLLHRPGAAWDGCQEPKGEPPSPKLSSKHHKAVIGRITQLSSKQYKAVVGRVTQLSVQQYQAVVGLVTQLYLANTIRGGSGTDMNERSTPLHATGFAAKT